MAIPRFDEIGYWSEVKLDIVREYAQAYSRILSARKFRHAYIDGFAGAGTHISRRSREFILGSPLNALAVKPPFHDYYLIDLDGDKADLLGSYQEVRDNPSVHVRQGDCNVILRNEVFPLIRYEDYRRALCVLDPYGLHLDWEVIQAAGDMRTIELFLNFPIMDMNRNALWNAPDLAGADGRARMTAFWGDDSWRQAAYQQQENLFGDMDDFKRSNEDVVQAFCKRLKDVAGFEQVPSPVPMRNSTGAVVYYLIFASHRPVAADIVNDIFEKHRYRKG